MRKISILTILSLLVISVLAVGGAAVAQDQEEIVLWDLNTQAESEHEVIENAIARFEADHPGYTVNHVPTSNDDYKTKLQVAMGADNEPDIFMTWGGGPLKEYVDADKVMDITDELREDNWIDRFVQGGLEINKFYGNNYGVPIIGMRSVLFFYRTDIFEEVGVEVPETFAELKDVVVELRESGYIPIALANQNQWPGSMHYMYLVDRIGGKEAFLNAANRENGGSFTDEPFIEAGRKLQELVDLEAFPSGVNGLDENQGQSRQLLYAGRAAMYLMGDWAYGSMLDENPEILDNIDFFEYPAIEGGKGDPSNVVGSPGGNSYHVAQSSEHQDMAVEFLKYLSDEQSAEQLVDLGNLPPFQGVDQYLTDPFMMDVYNVLNDAEYIQLYYDQYLQPQIAQAHLNTMHGLFDNSTTPEEAAQTLEDAAQQYFNE